MESKKYNERHKIREVIENDYLTRFYGDDEKVRLYVKRLLLRNFKYAAISINQDILVMGNSITYSQIYPKIEKKFQGAEICRLPIDVAPKPADIKLKRLNDDYLDTIIYKLEKGKIGIVDTQTLFQTIFKTDIEVKGGRDSRTFSFLINGIRYNEDLNYLKIKIINYLKINDK